MHSLTNPNAIVPRQESSNFESFICIETWNIINTELARLTQKPSIALYIREQDYKAKAIIVGSSNYDFCRKGSKIT